MGSLKAEAASRSRAMVALEKSPLDIADNGRNFGSPLKHEGKYGNFRFLRFSRSGNPNLQLDLCKIFVLVLEIRRALPSLGLKLEVQQREKGLE